ncbi:MAG: glycoside hydrolase family 97 C-terminal domain-containing protein [Phycisphaerales bacterium]|nr:MAG: glycoside hydrolase family 97 C-terminal domain-containing protein [Phycisphaerales bacterium]UCF17260.1 MAG: glycoside hydrolase family 97 C-terminal domain-containing protein [Phycisphaerales bacterium]
MTAEAPKQFLKDMPVAWDDTKFLAAFPCKYVVLARRKGNRWILGCLSGEETPRKLNLDLSFLSSGKYKAIIIADGPETRMFKTDQRAVTAAGKPQMTIHKYGSFVAQLTPAR